MSTRHKLGLSRKAMVVIAIKGYLLLLAMIAGLSFVKQAFAEEIKVADNSLSVYLQKHCKRDCVDSELLRVALMEASEKTKVDPLLLAAVIEVESGYRPKALNTTSGRSVGLTQVQVYWHRDKFRGKDYFDVFENVQAGAIILGTCQKKHGNDVSKSLWCYNGYQKDGIRRYAGKVLVALAKLKSSFVVI